MKHNTWKNTAAGRERTAARRARNAAKGITR